MTTIKVATTVDLSKIEGAAKQLPFALSNAIYGTLKNAQAAQIAHMKEAFTIRRADYLKLSVKITQKPRKNTLVGVIAISPPGDSADIFAKFEQRTIKKPTAGKNIAIPVTGSPIKRNERTIVKTIDKPRALLAGSQKGKAARTAFIKPAEGSHPAEIFIKRGARGKPRLAYVLRPYVPLKPILTFEKVVTDEVRRTFDSEFDKALKHALATAK